jgi:hypothetical protein
LYEENNLLVFVFCPEASLFMEVFGMGKNETDGNPFLLAVLCIQAMPQVGSVWKGW